MEQETKLVKNLAILYSLVCLFQVFKNLQLFQNGKSDGDDLFDRLTVRNTNQISAEVKQGSDLINATKNTLTNVFYKNKKFSVLNFLYLLSDCISE